MSSVPLATRVNERQLRLSFTLCCRGVRSGCSENQCCFRVEDIKTLVTYWKRWLGSGSREQAERNPTEQAKRRWRNWRGGLPRKGLRLL